MTRLLGLSLALAALIGVAVAVPARSAAQSQDRYPVRRLTFHPGQEGFPSWSSDGQTIVYSLFIRGDTMTGLWKVPAGGGEARQFTPFIGEHPDWSPEGHYIVFDAEEGNAVWLVAASGGQPIRVVPASISIFRGGNPNWSPDGRRIAFKEGSNLRVLDLRTGESSIIFSQDGMLPLPGCWSRDGNHIYVTVRHAESQVATIWLSGASRWEKESGGSSPSKPTAPIATSTSRPTGRCWRWWRARAGTAICG